jgi:hypothetical protein
VKALAKHLEYSPSEGSGGAQTLAQGNEGYRSLVGSAKTAHCGKKLQ